MTTLMIDSQFFYSLITSVFIGGVAGYLGSLMITKRMALVGDAVGHIALPGVALAVVYNFNIILGAFISLMIGVIVIWLFKTGTNLHTEALTGIVFAVSVAIAFLLLPSEDLETALIGDITKISATDVVISVFFSIIIFLILKKIFPKMILATLSDDLALSQKINVKKYDLIYLIIIGVIVALGIKILGSLLIGALVVIPASASRNVSRNMFEYSYGGMLIGIISCILGVALFSIIGFPAGPLIVLVSAVIFLITFLLKK